MRSLICAAIVFTGALFVRPVLNAAAPEGQGYLTPRAAARALVAAAKSDDIERLTKVLGPSAKDILVTNDTVADTQTRRKFVALAETRMSIASDPKNPNMKILEVGKDAWPLPIPLVRQQGRWHFDLERGKREILARRIGANELVAIDVCRGYVEAQNDYAEVDRTGSGAKHYAQKIISSQGKRDGLYWPSVHESDESPIGDAVTHAFAEGYTKKNEPYHGYYFKILTAQGSHATGGQMSYLQRGLMTKGFALIAWPSSYGSTGTMTFIVDKSGIVYQKNLGSKTDEIAGAYRAYDPDETWSPVGTSARK